MRLDCPAGGTGTACFLGKTKGSFSANFDPLSGEPRIPIVIIIVRVGAYEEPSGLEDGQALGRDR